MADKRKNSKQKEKARQKGECMDEDNHYNFRHSRRGIAIIIINEKCMDEAEKRKGCNIDLGLLQATFCGLGFEIRTFWDQKAKDLLNNVHRVSKEDFTDTDCLAIAISTHGSEVQTEKGVRQDTIYARDAEIQTRLILDMFNDEKCPTLIGKPRLVFIQACRGVNMDEGVQIKMTRTKSSVSSSTHGGAGSGGDQTDAIPSQVQAKGQTVPFNQTYVVTSRPKEPQTPPLRDVVVTPAPCFEDYLVMYATPPGYYAFRRPSTGSWFIRCLKKVLLDKNYPGSLTRRLTKVIAEVTDLESSSNKHPAYSEKKQTPVIYSMLKKDITLLPKNAEV